MEDVIDVFCLVFPDGTTFFSEFQRGMPLNVDRYVEAWKAQQPADLQQRRTAAEVTGGVVIMRMLRSEYLRIPATSLSCSLAAEAGQ